MFRVCILRAMFESFTRNAQVSIATSTEDVRQNGVEIKHLAKKPGRAGCWTFTGRAALAAAWRWWADVYYFHDPELMLAGRCCVFRAPRSTMTFMRTCPSKS